jgi:50S ribosomal subunit-associated GTPase HflX
LQLLVGPQEEFVRVSASTGLGLDRLADAVSARLDRRSSLVELTVPLADGRTVAAARAAGVVASERVEGDTFVLEVRLADGALGNLRRAASSETKVRIVQPAEEPYLRMEDTP